MAFRGLSPSHRQARARVDQPGLVHRHCFGLMQIKYATAREMGYKGDAKGFLTRRSILLTPCLISPTPIGLPTAMRIVP
jgi:hypothetical protein